MPNAEVGLSSGADVLVVPSTSFPHPLPKLDLVEDEHVKTGAHSINSNDSCTGDSVLDSSEVDSEDVVEEDNDEFPSLDQRHLNAVHEELEKLNIATDVINKLELQLDSARAAFRETQTVWSEKLKELSKKYGSAIAKARPYYEAKLKERSLRDESQRAAIRFERASNLLGVAKQQVSLTQDSLTRQTHVHPECLEVLNHHIQRVSEAEGERAQAEDAHAAVAAEMLAICTSISTMEKEHRSAIKKSRSYFDQRLEFTRVLDQQKKLILRLEAEVRQKKADYTTSLRNLERISDSIHEQRSIGSASARSTAATATHRDAISTSVVAESESAHPPPYRPTAPPAYDAHHFDERYAISPPEEQDESLAPVLSMLSEEADSEPDKHRRSLGSGVILLAQQLMGGSKSGSTTASRKEFDLIDPAEDVSYRTSFPDGMPCASSSDDSSEVSSLASGRTGGGVTDDEQLMGMLRSHSSLIQEIDASVNRVSSMFKRSISDAHTEEPVIQIQ